MTYAQVMDAVAHSCPELRKCPFCGRTPRVGSDLDPLVNAYSVEIFCDCHIKMGPRFYNAKLAEDAISNGEKALKELAEQWNGNE